MEIGIFSIFIGNYTSMYPKFIENMSRNFMPKHPKKFYIVTDDRTLPSFGENVEFLYTELIGFPYETAYRFKYFLLFTNITSDVIYFLNSNSICNVEILDVLPDETGYVFTHHNFFWASKYKEQTFDKNPNSTSYIPPPPLDNINKYTYVGGRFYGATKDKFLEMCVQLNNNIDKDEQNRYHALWHDESHINHYVNIILNRRCRFLDISYHVPEESMNKFKDIKIIYLNKYKTVKNLTTIKKTLTSGVIIKNKYNKDSVFFATLNVLIATTGRSSLQRMLESISSQLCEEDCLTIVFDGCFEIPTHFDLSKFKCEVQLYNEPTALKFWGHGVRNKYASILKKRDFIMHADDDDIYSPDAFSNIRSDISNVNALHVYKFKNNIGELIPTTNVIREGNIGTPCGIIPYELNKKGIWLHRYGGDGVFYESIAQQVDNIVYSDKIIYYINPPDTKSNIIPTRRNATRRLFYH